MTLLGRLGAALAALVLFALSACTTATPGDPTRSAGESVSTSPADPTSTIGSPAATVDHELGQGYLWHGPADATVKPFAAEQGECASEVATIAAGDQRLTLVLLAKDCESTPEEPINGRHGRYLVPPDRAQELTPPTSVPTGSAVVFWETYSEYTNSRTDYADSIALITLTSGVPYAALMITTTGKQPALDRVRSAACGIRLVGAAPSGSCGS